MSKSLIVLLLFLPIFSWAQNNQTGSSQTGNDFPIVSISSEIINDKVNYSFVSNLHHPEYKVPLFIDRMKNKYTIIIDLTIDPVTEAVVLVLPKDHLPSDLLEIIKKFKYSNYEIN